MKITLLTVMLFVACVRGDVNRIWDSEDQSLVKLAAEILEIHGQNVSALDIESRMRELFPVGKSPLCGIQRLAEKVSIGDANSGMRISWYKERMNVAFVLARDNEERLLHFDIFLQNGLVNNVGMSYRTQ